MFQMMGCLPSLSVKDEGDAFLNYFSGDGMSDQCPLYRAKQTSVRAD
jgi:hypothetical protein